MLFITIFASIFLHSNVILLDWKVFYVLNYVYFFITFIIIIMISIIYYIFSMKI
jgi:hypothetical protein